jgi:hypothetical protein
MRQKEIKIEGKYVKLNIFTYSPLYADNRPKNVLILLNMDHLVKGYWAQG